MSSQQELKYGSHDEARETLGGMWVPHWQQHALTNRLVLLQPLPLHGSRAPAPSLVADLSDPSCGGSRQYGANFCDICEASSRVYPPGADGSNFLGRDLSSSHLDPAYRGLNAGIMKRCTSPCYDLSSKVSAHFVSTYNQILIFTVSACEPQDRLSPAAHRYSRQQGAVIPQVH